MLIPKLAQARDALLQFVSDPRSALPVEAFGAVTAGTQGLPLIPAGEERSDKYRVVATAHAFAALPASSIDTNM